MKLLAPLTTLAVVMAFSGTTGADNATPPAEKPDRGGHTNEAKDWSQTHLFPGPVLREQIERTNVFLQENTPAMIKDTSELKSEGVLDRRGASRIRNALDHARRSLISLAESIEAEAQIDGWSARMISYELGMAADTFSKEAVSIEAGAAPNTEPKGGDGVPNGLSSEGKRRRRLANVLRETSDLLKETARAIVHHLK